MASVKRQKDGTYSIRVTVGSRDTRREVRRRGIKSAKQAKQIAADLELRMGNGQEMAGSNMAFADYFQQWIELYKLGKYSASTSQWYRTAQKYVAEFFGSTPMSQINKLRYQDFINWLGTNPRKQTGSPLAKKTVEKINRYVRTMIRDAIEVGLITVDFTRHVNITGAASKPASQKFLSVEDFKRVVELAVKRANMQHMSNYIIAVQSYLGTRFEETVGLTWDCVDFEHNTVKINKSWNYKSKKQRDNFGGLKNKSSYRTVPAPAVLMNLLHRLHKEQAELFMKQGYRDSDNLVFRNFYHRIVDNNSINDTLKRLCTAAGTDHPITSQGLRHTHGSVLIYAGIDIVSVSKRLGHADLQTTMSTYIHELDEMKARDDKAIVQVLDNLGTL